MEALTCGTTKYTAGVVGGVICLVDLDEGMTITNNARAVIDQLRNLGYDVVTQPVIYLDTSGTDTWDQITINEQGRFSGFRHVGANLHRDHAIIQVREM